MDTSPFHGHFGTNYVPTDDEVAQIRNLLEKPRSEAESIANEIARHTLILAALRQKQQAHAAFIANHTALLALIRRLPLEVLLSIFTLCLPTDHIPSLAPHEAPMLLAHVCRRWREVVFRSPSLWTSLHINIPIYPEVPISYKGLRSSRDSRLFEASQLSPEELAHNDNCVAQWEQRMARYSEAISSWLSRAGKLPLHISLQLYQNLTNPNKGKAERDRILQVVCSFSHQWHTLQVHAPDKVLMGLLSIPASRVPILQKVCIQWDVSYRERIEGISEPKAPIPQFTLLRASKLASLSLQNIAYPLRQFPVEWNCLTELVLGKFAEPNRDHFAPRPVLVPARALDILERCPNLVRCKLIFGKTYSRSSHSSVVPDGVNRACVTMPSLSRFCITEGDPLFDFFDYLELPVLSEVVFKTTQYPRADKPSTLLSLIRRHGANMKKLVMDDTMMSPTELEECLTLMPSLTTLKLTRSSYIRTPFDRSAPPETNFVVGYLTPELWDKLTASESNKHTALLPNLVSFSLRVHAPELILPKILSFLQSRRCPSPSIPGVVPLRRFSLMLYITEPEHRYPAIPALLAERGVDVSLMDAFEVKYRRTYGDSLLGPNDFVVKPVMRPSWLSVGDKEGMWWGVEESFADDD